MESYAHKKSKVPQEGIQQTALQSPVYCVGMEGMEMEFKAGSEDVTFQCTVFLKLSAKLCFLYLSLSSRGTLCTVTPRFV